MSDATTRLTDLRSSTSSLLLGLEAGRWKDADMREASLLPDWTRGHVLTHIARNADGIASTVSGALRGERVKRYPGGPKQRDADIEAGAGRTALELIADVRESAERLDRVFAAAEAAGQWDAPCDDRPIGEYVTARWREVEVHRVDAAGNYQPRDWPPAFVSYLVEELAPGLVERVDQALHIEIAPEGSTMVDLPGRSWTTSNEPTVEVIGPDWAIAAWLAGRANVVRDALTATPALRPWL